jgi:cobalamin biosynthesis Mg chelatase CobN
MKKLAVLLGSLATLLLLAVAPAGAHGGDGEAEITSVTRDGGQVTVVAHVKYVEDGHGVPDATVTVVVDDGTPVPMEAGAEEGDYQATLPAAPEATIRVTSVEPATTAEATAPAAADPTTTAATETSEASPTTAADTTTTAIDSDDDASAPVTAPEDVDGDSDDSSSSLIVIAVIAIVVLAAIVAAVVLRRKPAGGADA